VRGNVTGFAISKYTSPYPVTENCLVMFSATKSCCSALDED